MGILPMMILPLDKGEPEGVVLVPPVSVYSRLPVP